MFGNSNPYINTYGQQAALAQAQAQINSQLGLSGLQQLNSPYQVYAPEPTPPHNNPLLLLED